MANLAVILTGFGLLGSFLAGIPDQEKLTGRETSWRPLRETPRFRGL